MILQKTKALQLLVNVELKRGTKARVWHLIRIEKLFKMVSKACLSTLPIILIQDRVLKELKVLTNLMET